MIYKGTPNLDAHVLIKALEAFCAVISVKGTISTYLVALSNMINKYTDIAKNMNPSCFLLMIVDPQCPYAICESD